jgi:hypothetical protein
MGRLGRLGGTPISSLFRRARIQVRVPATAFEDEIASRNLSMGCFFLTGGASIERGIDDPLFFLPFVAAGGALILVSRHSQTPFLHGVASIRRDARFPMRLANHSVKSPSTV